MSFQSQFLGHAVGEFLINGLGASPVAQCGTQIEYEPMIPGDGLGHARQRRRHGHRQIGGKFAEQQEPPEEMPQLIHHRQILRQRKAERLFYNRLQLLTPMRRLLERLGVLCVQAKEAHQHILGPLGFEQATQHRCTLGPHDETVDFKKSGFTVREHFLNHAGLLW